MAAIFFLFFSAAELQTTAWLQKVYQSGIFSSSNGNQREALYVMVQISQAKSVQDFTFTRK